MSLRALGLAAIALVTSAAMVIACDDDENDGGVVFRFDGGSIALPDGSSSSISPVDAASDDAEADDAGGPDAADSGDAEAPIVVEGNAWGYMSCVLTDENGTQIGSPCITYTIGHCADESAYGAKCSAGTPPITGPSECSQDKRSTTYRCHHDWCARGCVPGGSAPNWNYVPVYSCTTSPSCN